MDFEKQGNLHIYIEKAFLWGNILELHSEFSTATSKFQTKM